MSEAEFSTVTEMPGNGVSTQQLTSIRTRYHWAARYAEGKDVLEVGCGGGQGLGYLARAARRVVGGDIDDSCVRVASEHYTDDRPIEVLKLDAQDMPFGDASFDVVMLFEAIYYLPEPRRFIAEARRVLRPDGVLLICTVNREWSGQNPSPFSVAYYSAADLAGMLREAGFSPRAWAAFAVKEADFRARVVSAIRFLAARLHLIPKTMKGRERLRRIFHGKLTPMPHEVTDDIAPLEPLVDVSFDEPVAGHKVLYVAGTLADR